MTSVSGLEFREAWAHRVRARVAGLSLAFIGREQFVKNKAAAARAKDLADLALLEEAAAATRVRGRLATKRRAKSRRR
jgi:hypothetical protein